MDHSPEYWSEVFFFHLLKCLLLSLGFYICVSQGSVKMHLLCGGIYNNHIIGMQVVRRVCQ